MMNKTSKTPNVNLSPGTRVKGKWHKKEYSIMKKLGHGAIGSVYLCKHNNQLAALKLSEKGSSMTMEVNVLKSLEKVQGYRLGPYLIDVDDWLAPNGNQYSFYVMEYVEGVSMQEFIKNNGTEWIGVFMLQLLDDLEKLHQSGWVFGDLKLENIIISSSPARIRWIDVGGTTQIGRAIKEYTEFYDRGYWQQGSRKAEPSYDLFAFVMVFLHIFYPKQFSKGTNPQATLLKRLNDVPALKVYRESLRKAILGKYPSSQIMKQEIAKAIYEAQKMNKSEKHRRNSFLSPTLLELIGLSIVAVGYYVSSLLIP